MVERFLGGGWASAHGPTSPRELLVWVLDSGFAGLVPAPSVRPVAWPALAPALADLPARIPAVRATGCLPADPHDDQGLASTVAGEGDVAVRAIAAAVEIGRRLGGRVIVIEPGSIPLDGNPDTDLGDPSVAWTEDAAAAVKARRSARIEPALDAVCRRLHGLARAHDDVRFALRTSRFANGIGDSEALGHIFDDLANLPLEYWHDSAVAARRDELLGEPQGEPLERFASRLAGISLSDAVDGSLNALPGSGSVDYPLLAAYGRRRTATLPAALELDPSVEATELPGIHAYLDKLHL